MKVLFITTLSVILNLGILYSQVDTLISYSVKSTEVKIIIPPEKVTYPLFEHTTWNYGTYPGFINLPLEEPNDTAPNSGFTDLFVADSLYNLTDYPVRTAVKIFYYDSDTIKQCCSGIMVSDDLVLTAAHCVYFNFDDDYNDREFRDSLLIAPVYNDGQLSPIFGSSKSLKYFIFKTWYDGVEWDDIALIKLSEPIGEETGWVGIAYNEADNFFEQNVFHKFSYPGETDPVDTSKVYTGNTLFYNYGCLDLITSTSLGYNIQGIPGQSGSSMLYTDNESFYSFGVMNWSYQSKHYRITAEKYFALEYIINGGYTVLNENIRNVQDGYSLSQNFPNPFNSSTTIRFSIPKYELVTIRIFNINGILVRTLINDYLSPGDNQVIWDGKNINGIQTSSGYYYCVIYTSKKLILSKPMLLIK